MIPSQIESYFARLHERLGEAAHYPSKPVRIGDWKPAPSFCHDNVARMVSVYPACKAVTGWLIGPDAGGGRRMYVAHSIIREGEDTYDITPLDYADSYVLFLKHEGTEAEFDELKITWSGKFYPFYIEVSEESGEIREEAAHEVW